MASWIQNRLKAAEDLLQAVDRTANRVSSLREKDDGSPGRSADRGLSGPGSTGFRPGPAGVRLPEASSVKSFPGQASAIGPLKPLTRIPPSTSSHQQAEAPPKAIPRNGLDAGIANPPEPLRPAQTRQPAAHSTAQGKGGDVAEGFIPQNKTTSSADNAKLGAGGAVGAQPSTAPSEAAPAPEAGGAHVGPHGDSTKRIATPPGGEVAAGQLPSPPSAEGGESGYVGEAPPAVRSPAQDKGRDPGDGVIAQDEATSTTSQHVSAVDGTSAAVATPAAGLEVETKLPSSGEAGGKLEAAGQADLTLPGKEVAGSVEAERKLMGESAAGTVEAEGKLQETETTSGAPLEEAAGHGSAGFEVPSHEASVSKAPLTGQASSLSEVSGPEDPDGRSTDAGLSEEDDGRKGRESRLVKMVDQLKRRLEQCRAENEQLEEMLRHADARATGGATDVSRLEDALARADVARISAEAALSSGLAAKEAELEAARKAMETARQDAAAVRERLAALEEANHNLIRERQASEGRILQAVREEVAATENRLEEERAAHARTRREFAEREQQIEGGVAESASALTEMQRNLSERTRKLEAAESRAAGLERSLAVLQREHTALQQSSKQREGMAAPSPGGLQEVTALKLTCDQLRAAARAAQAAEAAAKQEAAGARAECDALRQELALASSNAVLEQQFKEVTDLLYLKQTQLEKMAADKAAQQLALERELALTRDEAERIKRRVKTDRASATFASDGDVVVPMEAMGEAYYRLANNDRVGGAVKAAAGFMDASASTAVRFLKQYPLGRLLVFAYIVGIHLFIWLLINRLQHRAFSVDHALGLRRGGLN